MTTLPDLHKLLDVIEEEEAKILNWGDTGGIFTEDEIIQYIENILPSEDPDDVLDDLVSHAMLLPVSEGTSRIHGYRSRMGESVHLFRNLRQWFHGKTIEQTSTLVSDFRFLRRSRQYPKRDQSLLNLIERFSSSNDLPKNLQSTIEILVGEYTLSGFQVRATERILSAIPKHKKRTRYSSATIICAGTGSGKTLAFYLPGLSSLAHEVLTSPEPRVRVLAIYPRKELLKDQFNEAWEQCRKLDDMIQASSGRKLRIGAMFSDTKESAKYALKNNETHLKFSLLKCATPGCEGEMRWQKNNIDKGLEILQCSLCAHSVSGDEVALTRQSMTNNPPDILFTTTEMLNIQMGNPSRKKLFGIGTKEPIPLILLDEVHTYSGTQGAQTAFLLRRWMKLSKSAPHFVGLSATLADAENYFSRLTGTNSIRVRLVEPLHDELTEEGSEYLLALRGDPVSQKALLSTTIQTAMLTRRIQDNRRNKKSHGTWGSKTFVFTDDLDISNRLLTQLADAEGWRQDRGQLVPNHERPPLALLRNPASGSASKEKLAQYGQDWSSVKQIGFGLNQDDRAMVSRTTSQDAGVDAQSDIVVATASLEVGFNDPEVGAVIQHKSPRDYASYLQRKGRAGRQRNMRPWMIIVLSEFGRDRTTYQHYERLLDPEIKLQSLPIDNSHIQKMQAAMATLDWLSTRVHGFNPWSDLNKPKKNYGNKNDKLIQVINDVLEGGSKQEELANYLTQALVINEEALNQLLWKPPRSILMEFLPTLVRRLETKWGQWSFETDMLVEWAEVNQQWGSPVPEFIPDNLFSDLNLPTLHISLQRGANVTWEGMRFFQGLREFAPGRISKRFSVQQGQLSDLLLPDEIVLNKDLDNTSVNYEVCEAFGDAKTVIDRLPSSSGKEDIIIYQPHQILTKSSNNYFQLADTSNSILNWKSIFKSSIGAESLVLPKGCLWSNNFQSITFYTHRSLTQLEVIRYNTGSNAELKFRNGQKIKAFFNWKDGGQPSGIGARLWVDASKMEFKIPFDHLINWLQDESLLRVLRSSYLQDQLRKQGIFEGNKFKSDWVYECFIASLSIEVVNRKCGISIALNNICNGMAVVSLDKIPEILFQQDIDTENEELQTQRDQVLQRELKELLGSEDLLLVLNNLGSILTESLIDKPEFLIWCRNIIGNTLAAAVQQSVCTLFPDVDDKELIVDPEYQDDILTIWLCEQDSGGIGIITQLQDSYAEDPLRILNILSQTIQASDYEQLDCDLRELLTCSESNERISHALKGVRNSENYHQRVTANYNLKHVLTEYGFQFTHSFSSVLYSRILRDGSNPDKDQHLLNYLVLWDEIEEQVGFELPINIIALVISVKEDPQTTSVNIFNKACRIQSLLWPRGNTVRQAVLSYYNQFQIDNNRTERLLVEPLCTDTTKVITIEESDWLIKIHEILAKEGKIDLLVPRENNNEIASIIAIIYVTPIDTHGLLFYPRVSLVKRKLNKTMLRIELAEAIQ